VKNHGYVVHGNKDIKMNLVCV